MNAPSIELSLSSIAAFSSDGRVFRAFGHLLGAIPGELLLVPIERTTGNLRDVVDGCPWPWEEVWSVLDTPVAAPALMPPEELCQRFPRLAQVTPYGWLRDAISPFAAGVDEALRLTHPSGIRFSSV